MVHQLPSNQKFDRRAKKSYYSLQQHRRKEHGAKQRRGSVTVADLNKIVEEEGEDGEKLNDELSTCQQFLVKMEMENGRFKVINFQRYLTFKLNTKIINEELKEVFNKLDSAAKINFSPGCFLRKVKTGEYRFYYAQDNNTFFKNCPYCVKKPIWLKIQGKKERFDIVEQCIQKRQNTKWKFNLIKIVTIFAALLKNIPMGCPDSVLPEPSLKKHSVNFLSFIGKVNQPYKDYVFLFSA